MKPFFFIFLTFIVLSNNIIAQTYTPSPENLKAREIFSNDRFGFFIHWGPFSIPGDGEWVMNNRNITVKNYKRLEDFFNPIEFNAAEWVEHGKKCGNEIYYLNYQAS